MKHIFERNLEDDDAEEDRRCRSDGAATAADDFFGLGAENAAEISESSFPGTRKRCELPVTSRSTPTPEGAARGKCGRMSEATELVKVSQKHKAPRRRKVRQGASSKEKVVCNL